MSEGMVEFRFAVNADAAVKEFRQASLAARRPSDAQLRKDFGLPPGSPDWWRFLAAHWPKQYGVRSYVIEQVLENNLWDTCQDQGHEFWCRMGPGTCHRRTALSCNDES